MDTGTKARTAAMAVASIAAVMAVWKAAYEIVFALTQSVVVAAAVATVIAVAILIIDTAATYYNNDYTEEAVIGTATTRRLKENPDLPVLVDIDQDEDEEEDPEEDPEEYAEADEVIEEGEES